MRDPVDDEPPLAFSAARAQLSSLADRVCESGRPARITRRGRPDVALVAAADLDRLVGLAQETLDARAAAAARAEAREAGGAPVPWADVKSELGLT
jgi:prevent-host-death family protein